MDSYYSKNKTKIIEYQRERYLNNKDKISKYNKQYYTLNKSMVNFKNTIRRLVNNNILLNDKLEILSDTLNACDIDEFEEIVCNTNLEVEKKTPDVKPKSCNKKKSKYLNEELTISFD
jgi:phosphoglucomutase